LASLVARFDRKEGRFNARRLMVGFGRAGLVVRLMVDLSVDLWWIDVSLPRKLSFKIFRWI
jgi:hypothetical protein